MRLSKLVPRQKQKCSHVERNSENSSSRAPKNGSSASPGKNPVTSRGKSGDITWNTAAPEAGGRNGHHRRLGAAPNPRQAAAGAAAQDMKWIEKWESCRFAAASVLFFARYSAGFSTVNRGKSWRTRCSLQQKARKKSSASSGVPNM